MRVVVADAVDVVVLHEQHHGNAGVGEDLAVGVVERAAGIVGRADLAVQQRVQRRRRASSRRRRSAGRGVQPRRLGATRSTAGAEAFQSGVGHVGLVGQPQRLAARARRNLEHVRSWSLLWAIMSST